MPRPVDNARPGACVNVLKKVRTNGGWKLCPVVREANGRLRDRVRVDGRTEVYGEGVYYLEWREDGRRRREAIPNPAEVLERARLKSLELEARRAGAADHKISHLCVHQSLAGWRRNKPDARWRTYRC
jgi:hypothetical protein